jgi:hypothetical protein
VERLYIGFIQELGQKRIGNVGLFRFIIYGQQDDAFINYHHAGDDPMTLAPPDLPRPLLLIASRIL